MFSDEVKKNIDILAPGGGFVFAAVHNIQSDVSPENFWAMWDTLQEYGCFIGSAAIIILSENDSAKKMALNAMRFFEHESCGQCTPCRVGTSKAVNLMQQKNWDIDLLEELSQVMINQCLLDKLYNI